MSLNNEKICREIIEDKIAVCEKTAGGSTEWELYGFEISVFESASSSKNIQFQDMGNENRFLGTFRGHSKRPNLVMTYYLHACRGVTRGGGGGRGG